MFNFLAVILGSKQITSQETKKQIKCKMLDKNWSLIEHSYNKIYYTLQVNTMLFWRAEAARCRIARTFSILVQGFKVFLIAEL